MRETVSACMIVKDEAERLPDALASVAFCDEVVVVDSGSADATVAIAEARGATVVRNPWPGFAAQRNVAIDHAHGDWVLEIDADERVSAELRSAIEAFLDGPSGGFDQATLARRNVFLGRPLGRAAKFPEYHTRLLRRGRFRHDERRQVHEGVSPAGPVAPLEGELTHLLAGDLREALGDAWRDGRLEAAHAQIEPSPAGIVRGVALRPAAKFAYRVVVDGGWRDGWRGIALITIECAADASVWVRLAAGGPPATAAGAPGP
jgi:glycosyltransferase involved in cell wall biosynthesis